MNVATEILNQLGGNKFVVMTGSKNFVSDGNTLRMTLARNKSSANQLWVTLLPDDTYKMSFFRITGGNFNKKTLQMNPEKTKVVKEYDGIYCDQLQGLFTEVTGMYTKL